MVHIELCTRIFCGGHLLKSHVKDVSVSRITVFKSTERKGAFRGLEKVCFSLKEMSTVVSIELTLCIQKS